jgi:hypothetical protein
MARKPAPVPPERDIRNGWLKPDPAFLLGEFNDVDNITRVYYFGRARADGGFLLTMHFVSTETTPHHMQVIPMFGPRGLRWLADERALLGDYSWRDIEQRANNAHLEAFKETHA